MRANKPLRPRPLRVNKPLRPRTLRANKAYLFKIMGQGLYIFNVHCFSSLTLMHKKPQQSAIDCPIELKLGVDDFCWSMKNAIVANWESKDCLLQNLFPLECLQL